MFYCHVGRGNVYLFGFFGIRGIVQTANKLGFANLAEPIISDILHNAGAGRDIGRRGVALRYADATEAEKIAPRNVALRGGV